MKAQQIQEWFYQSAERFADDVAIEGAGRSVTYRELDEESNRLANFLLAAGLAKAEPVVIVAEDGVRAITSILGVLKAGGVFVPLDPHVPEKRIEAMAASVAPRWFVGEAKYLGLIDALSRALGAAARVVCLDPAEPREGAEPSGHVAPIEGFETYADRSRPAVEYDGDDVSYVYFTSGSTGQPKGIAGRLKGIDHFIRWEIETLELGPGTRVSQLLNFTFDGSLRDIFVALGAGGCVCLPPDRDTILDARRLVRWLDEQRVNVVHCVPSLFRSIVNEATDPGLFAALRYILMAGEPLLPADVKRWMGVFGERVRLINLYGTSETTMAKFTYFVTAADAERQSIPVGQPMPGARAVVVDEKGKVCPPGAIGEIYIRTPYRSHGYYNQPELTNEVFVPNPFGTDPSDIVYKTGDLGRVMPDGNFEFLGRRDQQVKVRGARVELAEIDNLLRRHEAVKEVAVVDYEDPSSNKYLCAYVVLQSVVDLGDLRDYVAEHLPDYMVPSVFLLMDELPRTVSGKVDRKALPSPEQAQAERSGEFTPPQTPVEEMLASLWSRILGVRNIGREQNFFQLGGHSLMATQITSRIRSVFQVELPLQSLFEAPTIAGLAQNIEEAMRESTGFSAPPVEPRERAADAPLSFAQQRLLFIELLEPGTAAYHINSYLRLKGRLNLPALEQTLAVIQQRHEALRTTFPIVDGPPVQRVNALAPPPVVNVVDLRGATDAQELGHRLARASSVPPFDLVNGPLWRTTLFRVGDDEHIALLTMHHIILDGWSMSMLIGEVSALYTAFAAGGPSPLPELPIQYADYALWQREWLQGEVLDAQLEYWRDRLAGAPPVLELPTDRPRPPVQTFRGGSRTLLLDTELAEGLKELARREGATLFMVLLAAYKTLLHRYTGATDIVVGTPIAGRTRTELEELIGFFVNTLVMRTSLAGDVTFRELLARVRETALGAYLHQDVPFERLIEELRPERDMSHTPFFQTVLALQNAPSLELHLAGLELTAMEFEEETAKFDLTLLVAEGAEGLTATMQYNADLFEATTVERMLGHLGRVLEAMVRDADARVGRVEVLAEEERRLLLEEWSGGARAGAEEVGAATLVELFEAQAAARPDAVALTFGETELTYAELNARANRLAHHLRSLGVGPDVLVGLCAERSVEMVVALVGVLKAGGAYLALDAEYPPERLRLMLEDAGVGVVLTQQRLLDALPETDAEVICLDAESGEGFGADERNLHVEVSPDNLAYVAYTSGSTGRPKGVAVTHRNVARLVRRNWFARVDEREVFLQFAPVAFDASTFEIWGALLNGARLAVMPPGVPSLEELGGALGRYGVTTLWLTAGLFHLMVDERLEDLKGVRQLLAGGDVLSVAHVRRFLRAAGEGSTLVNGYGPTENTTFTCCHVMRAGDREEIANSVPLGRPIANTQVYILDASLQPAAVGTLGELYAGGDGLARGYVGRPGPTAEKFIPDPFSAAPGARLYKTGDLARFLADGRVEFLGRRDEQVKVRGFRIELGEIEAALSVHEGVGACVVVANGEAGEEKRLAAYVVPSGERHSATTAEWREHLRARLPEYMVPSFFVTLDELPLTANGKVDRRALPSPSEEALASAQEFVAPRTTTEELLAGFWCELLGARRVGRHDNFFELGGHSLTATQVMTRVRTTFNVEIPLRRLFEAPTVSELARAVEEEVRAGHRAQLPPVAPRASEGPLPLSFAQQRLWFIDQLQPGTPQYNVPAAVRLTGELDADALERSLDEVVRRHESLRTSFTLVDGEPVQVVAGGCRVRMPVIDLSAFAADQREAEARSFIRAEAQRGFDLSSAPLLRAHLLRLGEREHIALLTMHHIVSDGWSMSMLVGEVSALYAAYAAGAPSPLAPLPVQYADYALWQREWLQGDVLDSQLSYWRERLEGAPRVLELPTDRPRPAVQSSRGGSRSVTLTAELSEGLKELGRREGATLFMTLLAGYTTLLHRYTGATDIVVGTPIAGRNYAEIENLIGFFVNTLVLRTELTPAMTARELIGQVRETALGAYLHQDVPFEKLIEELRPERDLSHTPLFQTMLVVQNTQPLSLQLPGLELTGLELEEETAKFDLTLLVAEGAEGLTATMQYNADLFEAATVERMLTHFGRVLEAMVRDADARVGRVEVLAEEERRLLVERWGRGEVGESVAGTTVTQLFEAQAAARPDAVAVVMEGAQLSYGELNRRANRLAHYLIKQGVGPEVPVGLCMERTPEMVVGLLGIMKAGGAYVPLDPAYPQERIAFMIEDARLPLLLTQERGANQLPLTDARLVLIDAQWDEIAAERDANPSSAPTARSAAYVIYTSGSTGKPKGVVVEHGGFSNLAEAQVRAFDLRPENRVLQFSSLSFDASIFEMVMALRNGATLHLARPQTLLPGEGLVQLLRREGVTNLTIPPSALGAVPDAELPALRTLVVAGEACPAELAARWGRGRRFFNAYGPTETTVWATVSESLDGSRKPDIGRPIFNTQAYVLNRPTLDADVGYLIAPMEQGLRLTTGAEFASVDAPPTPVQFDRLMPKAREMFPLGEQVEQTPWMGSRPSFPDSRPVIGRAPGLKDLWLDFGHTHWGLTLGPVSGRLLSEMMTGATPFCDPAPYQAERFLKGS